jgi:hypothetical protein
MHLSAHVVRSAAVIGAILGSLATATGALAKETSGPQAKLDSHLQGLAAAADRNANAVALGRSEGLRVSGGERVMVDVYVHGKAARAAAELRSAGMDVAVVTDKAPVPMVEGWLPLDAVDAVAKLAAVRAVVPVMASGTNAGSVQSQGDAAHMGPEARSLGIGPFATGQGVSMGVISDSMSRVGTGLAGSQASGDLPSGVRILKEGPTAATDEGRAMAEIIYDTAPGISDFLFASGTGSGPAGKANAIDQLTFAGADIVSDDIFYLGEPFFEDGVVARAVENAKRHGVAYFASAGNRGRQSWEGRYRPSPGTPGWHNFHPLAGGDDVVQNVVSVPNGNFVQIVLQWDELWGRAATDIDLFLDNVGTGATLVSDRTANNVTGIPSATVTWTNNTGAPVTVAARIQRFSGTAAPLMKYIARGDFGPFSIREWDTNSDAIDPDAASAQGAIAVAAVAANDPGHDEPRPYSSRGYPERQFIDGIRFPYTVLSPRIAGADGVATTVPGFGNFQGTSAAVASVAGVAALVKSAKPSMGYFELRDILQTHANAIDCRFVAGQPDTDCGVGFVLADRAVRQVLTPVATLVAPSNGSTEVLPNTSVVVTYSVEMYPPSARGFFSLVRTSNGARVDGDFVWFGGALVFKPKSTLEPGVQYTARAQSGALSSRFIAQAADATSTFTTTNRPIVESISPAANATGVSRTTQVVVVFNKAMDKASTGAAVAVRRESDGAAVPGTVNWFGDRALVFKASASLAARTRYRINVAGAGVRDTAGNVIANPTSSLFTTGN